jgi:hypothetical protein
MREGNVSRVVLSSVDIYRSTTNVIQSVQMELDIPCAGHCDQRETSIDTSMNGRVTRFIVKYPSLPIFVTLFIFFLLIKRQRMHTRKSYRFLDCIRFPISRHPCEKAGWFVKHHMTDWTFFFNPVHLTQYLSV